MKKLLKIFLLVALVLVVTFSAAATTFAASETARVSNQKMLLNGQNVKTAAYNTNDNNYFKLRDLAAILVGTNAGFNVDFDEATMSVIITSKTTS